MNKTQFPEKPRFAYLSNNFEQKILYNNMNT